MTKVPEHVDVIIIGAGPSGAVAASLLVQKGYQVLVLERQQFPRFSIGESLLPQCMQYLEEAGMLEAVQAANFQFKNGAAFAFSDAYDFFNFEEKFSSGWGTTFQVERDRFDKILADRAAEIGADIRYKHEIVAVTGNKAPSVVCKTPDQKNHTIKARFLLDASGFGRVLPRLLALDKPSNFPVRQSLFTHVYDRIDDKNFDRNKILISVHPVERDIWYWTIPFSDGRCSLGVVATPELLSRYAGDTLQKLQTLVSEEPRLKNLLTNAEYFMPARELGGYSCNVNSLHGPGFALLGNAGEFLDPVFSSGVTIAMRSASMAVAVLDRQLKGEAVDWEQAFAVPLKQGVNTFREFVEAWYDQRLQHIIFASQKSTEIKAMISSILAGYAWDTSNPYVTDTRRRLNVLAKICQNS